MRFSLMLPLPPPDCRHTPPPPCRLLEDTTAIARIHVYTVVAPRAMKYAAAIEIIEPLRCFRF